MTMSPVTSRFTMDIIATNGVPFRVVAIPPGGDGPNRHRVSADEATVEFYDRRYPHEADGQFTGGSYYLTTLLGDDEWGRGQGALCLDGRNAWIWTVDEGSMVLVRTWLRGLRSAGALGTEEGGER